MTSAGGATTGEQTTDAFGNTVSASGNTPSPFGFAGQYGYKTDAETGLMLLGHRYYDPSTGRFLSRDPIRAGYNWYTYCKNNPVNEVDPSGLFSLPDWETGLGGIIAGWGSAYIPVVAVEGGAAVGIGGVAIGAIGTVGFVGGAFVVAAVAIVAVGGWIVGSKIGDAIAGGMDGVGTPELGPPSQQEIDDNLHYQRAELGDDLRHPYRVPPYYP